MSPVTGSPKWLTLPEGSAVKSRRGGQGGRALGANGNHYVVKLVSR